MPKRQLRRARSASQLCTCMRCQYCNAGHCCTEPVRAHSAEESRRQDAHGTVGRQRNRTRARDTVDEDAALWGAAHVAQALRDGKLVVGVLVASRPRHRLAVKRVASLYTQTAVGPLHTLHFPRPAVPAQQRVHSCGDSSVILQPLVCSHHCPLRCPRRNMPQHA